MCRRGRRLRPLRTLKHSIDDHRDLSVRDLDAALLQDGYQPCLVPAFASSASPLLLRRPHTIQRGANCFDRRERWTPRAGKVAMTRTMQGRIALPLADPERLAELRVAAVSQKLVSIGNRRTNSPHEFYRYPARFTPDFARAAILAFSRPDGLVVDPFMGGGTTLVEAMRTGRRSIGSDLNELATFVSKVKTTVLNEADLAVLRRWTRRLPERMNLSRRAPSVHEWRAAGYLKDLDDSSTWRIRSLIALALAAADELPQGSQVDFARCIILRTAQWALDMRDDVPTPAEFRLRIATLGTSMVEAATRFANELDEDYSPPILLDQQLPGLSCRQEISAATPDLILTSPPYPGVYVNYHRWKLRGRREISAPYWIANRTDGLGLASYTMHARSGSSLVRYFEHLGAAFADLRQMASTSTLLVQMVGFNNVPQQLHQYLATMKQSGFEEVLIPELATADDGRLWRSVPGRRWWATTTTLQDVAPHTAREVVLIHRPTSISC